jgi:glycosyltransferase involved in cell wall biosynthesis
MNILLINHYAGTPDMGMEFRPYHMAREWTKLGHNVTILASSYSHLRRKNIDTNTNFEENLIDGIKYVWVKTPKYNGNGLHRVLNIFSFVKQTFFKSKYLSQKYNPDIVIASSTYPSDNYIAKKIAKISGAKHIYEVHDLWPLSPIEIGNMSKYNPFIILMQHGENFAYKHADYVVSMLPSTQEHMKKHGLDLRKWFYIPNGIVTEDWESSAQLPESMQNKIIEIKSNGGFIVGYSGGHAVSNSLNTLIDAAHILKSHNDIFFILVGNGVEKDTLMKSASGLQNVLFFDSISKYSIPTLLLQFNVAIAGTKKSKLYKYGVSLNKLIDYMMAKRPVIQHIGSNYDLVKNADCGISVEPENPQAIAEAILQLKNTSKENLAKMGENGHKYAIENHDYKVLAKRFLEILNS